MALSRDKSLLDEVTASKYHVAGRVPKQEPMAILSPSPLSRSCPEHFQSEGKLRLRKLRFEGKLPFLGLFCPCLNTNALLWTVRGRSCVSMWKRDSAPCPFTPQLAMTKDRHVALHKHTHYRK